MLCFFFFFTIIVLPPFAFFTSLSPHHFLPLFPSVQMKLFVCSVICTFLQVSRQNPTSHWTLLPHGMFVLYENTSIAPSQNRSSITSFNSFVSILLVLVVEVDGTLGQQPLRCLESPEERTMTDDQSLEIFWKKDGKQEAQRGNLYLVKLEESLGGGNYTCHSKDGSLLNHTVVLIQEDETERKKILVKTDQGTVQFKKK